jgi:predicted ribosome quality control (RQC) complex YloA/Tae2 family protein
MDALILEQLGRAWARPLEGLAFRGLVREVGGVRAYFGPRPGESGPTYALVARWVEPVWAWMEESPLPRERERQEASLRFDGSPLARLEVPPLDRRVRATFRDGSFLEIEVWPPGNAVLADREGIVRWVARRRTASTLRAELTPGKPYAPPPAPFRLDPRRATMEAVGDRTFPATPETAARLRHDFAGLAGPVAEAAAAECAAAAARGEEPSEALAAWAKRLYAPEGPVLGLLWEDRHRMAHLVAARAGLPFGEAVRVAGPWPEWDVAARLLAREFPEAISNEEIAEARSRVRRLERSLRAARADLSAARRTAGDRRKGEAILAAIAEVKRGAARARLPDPREPGRTLDIELDPKLPPHKNAARYFQLASKGERALQTVPVRIQVLEKEHAKGLELLESLERGVRPEGYAPPPLRGEVSPSRPARGSFGPPARGGEELPPRLLPRRYRTSEGWEVWIGKTNEGNDYLTHRLAHGEDLWFHVRGAPGSHVVLRRGKGKDEPSKATLAEVASWAAFYSKQRTSGLVPVVQTRKKYVRKPRGAKPGLASVERERVIFARPVEPPREAALEDEAAVATE